MLTLNDGRAELWQWDTGRTLAVDADCSQVHFSNKVFGRSIDVDVVNGAAIIPDVLLQTDNDLNVWAFVGTAENGYTKISKTFKVNRRNKPADYVFTPTDQMTIQTIQSQIGDLADLTTEAKDTLVAAINEAARTGGGAGSMDLRVADGYVQYSTDGGMTWTNLIAMAELKGADGITPTIGSNGNWYLGDTDTGKPSRGEKGDEGQPGKDGRDGSPGKDGADGQPGADGSPGQDGQPGADGVGIQSVVQTTTSTEDGGTNVVTVIKTDGTSSTFAVRNGRRGSVGPAGADGNPGADGSPGKDGADGKSAYQYAQDGGYTGTEAEFAAKLASGALIVHVTDNNGTLSADKSFLEIRDAILAGISVIVDYDGFGLPLIAISADTLNFGAIQCANDDTGAMIGTSIIEITSNGEVNDVSAYVEIPKTLPSPNALTFTGAVTGTYDGSAPLTVNIPSSGGGSGGSGGLPNWRLIKTLAFSSEIAEIIFSEDDNGEAFAVKEIMIVGTVPAFTKGGYIYCGIETGGLNAVWPTAGKEMRWWLASVDGVLKTMLAVSNTSVTLPADKNFGCPSDLVTIRIGASTGFTADGTLYVYGR